MLRLISLLMVLNSFFLIQTTIPKLPPRIPVHFNAAGVANGWGSPDTLWFLLGAQALTTLVFLIVPYFSQRNPRAVHFGSRKLSDLSPAQRARMISLLNDMAAYLSTVVNLFFVIMLLQIVKAATDPHPRIHPLLPMVLLGGGMAGIMLYYFTQFWRAPQDKSDGNPPNGVTP